MRAVLCARPETPQPNGNRFEIVIEDAQCEPNRHDIIHEWIRDGVRPHFYGLRIARAVCERGGRALVVGGSATGCSASRRGDSADSGEARKDLDVEALCPAMIASLLKNRIG